MSEEQIEYLDYVRPKRSQTKNRPVRESTIEPYKRSIQIESSQKEKNIQIVQPKQQKKQLNLSISVSLTKLTIIVKMAKIQEQQADAILLPYLDASLNYYPCTQFKEQLTLDQEKIKSLQFKAGELYLKCKKIHNYKYKAFVKVQQQKAPQHIVEGINSLFNLVAQKNIPINAIVFTYTQQLFDLQSILRHLVTLQGRPEKSFTIVFVVNNKQLLGKSWDILFSK